MTDRRIDALKDFLTRYRNNLERAFHDVPEESRETPPATDAWSAANVIEHLAVTEKAITGMLLGFLAEAPSRPADEGFDPSDFEERIDMRGFLDRSRKIKGPQPSGERTADEAWDDLNSSREGLFAALEQARGKNLDGFTHPHPLTGAPLDAYQWVGFVGVHEGRHAAQLEEMRSSLE